MVKKSVASRATAVRKPVSASPRLVPAAKTTTAPSPATASKDVTANQGRGTATIVAPRPIQKAPVGVSLPKPKTQAPPPKAAATTSRTSEANKNKIAIRAASQMTRRNMIRAENFSYVLGDLRIIVVLAVVLFAIMIILHLMLPGGVLPF